MNSSEAEKIVNSLLDIFILSGNVSLDLRKKGLEKKFKSDNTPVTNGDIEINNLLTSKITSLTPISKLSQRKLQQIKTIIIYKIFG